jgi:hypothetical protein
MTPSAGPSTGPSLSRRKRILFAALAVAFALLSPALAVFAVDIYLHGKYEKTAGFNVWGYRGPAVGRKQPGEFRFAFVGGSTAFGYGVAWDESIPALLERLLRAHSSPRFTALNLAYNNEGAYSMKFTLADYAYLDYDLVCLYEGYNDLNRPNFSVFRHDSPVFRLTGYLPIFPLIFHEKSAALLHGGDTGALYRDSPKTVFSASVAQRAAAGVLDATAAVGQSLERQLGRVTSEPARQIVGASATGCHRPWQEYCRSMLDAVDYARARGKQVLVITQPYESGAAWRLRHQDQQRELATMLARERGSDPHVRYVNLGDAVDLTDPTLSYDHMHLTARGNRIIAEALLPAVLEMAKQR